MKRREIIEIQLNNIISGCDSNNLYILLLELQSIHLMHGYAVALLSEFDNRVFENCNDNEMSEMISSGKYEKMFNSWLEESIWK